MLQHDSLLLLAGERRFTGVLHGAASLAAKAEVEGKCPLRLGTSEFHTWLKSQLPEDSTAKEVTLHEMNKVYNALQSIIWQRYKSLYNVNDVFIYSEFKKQFLTERTLIR